jgi:hypothetical protein
MLLARELYSLEEYAWGPLVMFPADGLADDTNIVRLGLTADLIQLYIG